MNTPLLRPLACLMAISFLACGGGGGGSSTPPPAATTPTLQEFAPTHGSPGTPVTITGTNLTGATSVSFNGQGAFAFSVVSATRIDAVVPSGTTTGPIQVVTPTGSATGPSFTVDPAQAPALTGFSPTGLATGTVVTLTGSHLVGASRVQFNGLDATSFTVVSDTQIRATAPAGLTAGLLSVTTPGGVAVSSVPYLVGTPIQVLMNTGFEQASPIIWQGDTGIIQPAPGTSNPDVVPHNGSTLAWLGGYGAVASDQISQDIYIPASAQSAIATFYLKVLTDETSATATDTLTVSALDTSGAVLGTLLTKSNLDKADYTACSVDLLPYKGRIVRLSFQSQENAALATSFLLDDVEAEILAPASDLRPLITEFTPTSGIAGETTLQITGGNFFGVTGVSLGSASLAYTLVDGTRLSVGIPAGIPAGSASLTIANAQGTGTSASPFTVVYGAPTITGLNPSQGPAGTPVVLTGTYLGYPGTTLTLAGQAVPLTSQSSRQILFSVPAGASSGALVLTTPGGVATGSFTVNAASTTLDLHVDKVELTQSTQTLDDSVPIVAGKPGLVRVFVLANQANTATPAVQVTLLNGGVPVPGYPKTVPAPAAAVPTAVDESSLAASWNLSIPGTDLTTPVGSGYSVQAVVDPAGAVAEADETNNTATVALQGTVVPIFKTTIFPVILSSGTGNITEANKAAWVDRLARMYPVASVDVAVGQAFTPSVSTLEADGTGWDTLLNDLTAKHVADGASDRYYFGALAVSYDSGVAGLGWVPPSSSADYKYRTAIGWDKTGYSDGGNFPEVFAHETGHNMGRPHSPCGNAASPDPDYPYPKALIGVWGYDSEWNQLKDPTSTRDIMGYCSPNWVSDYVYKKILAFRGGSGGFLAARAEDAPLPATPRECLIVRGIVHEDGTVALLPAFRTRALPSAIPSQGDYTLECVDAQGLPVYTAPLQLADLGCWPKGRERQFVMALPIEPSTLDAVAGFQVLRAGRTVAALRPADRTTPVATAPPEIRRLAPDRVQLTWDATVHPAALVRDADTGQVIAILSGGRQTLSTRQRRFDVVLSDGVSGRTRRLALDD